MKKLSTHIPKIIIETIPHKKQRYDTLGDYFIKRDGLQINISQLENPDYEFLITIHELIEWYLAQKKGIKIKDIDDFDIQYEKERVKGLHSETDEPGDDPKCPIYEEHQVASAFERLLCSALGIKWGEYDVSINPSLHKKLKQ